MPTRSIKAQQSQNCHHRKFVMFTHPCSKQYVPILLAGPNDVYIGALELLVVNDGFTLPSRKSADRTAKPKVWYAARILVRA